MEEEEDKQPRSLEDQLSSPVLLPKTLLHDILEILSKPEYLDGIVQSTLVKELIAIHPSCSSTYMLGLVKPMLYNYPELKVEQRRNRFIITRTNDNLIDELDQQGDGVCFVCHKKFDNGRVVKCDNENCTHWIHIRCALNSGKATLASSSTKTSNPFNGRFLNPDFLNRNGQIKKNLSGVNYLCASCCRKEGMNSNINGRNGKDSWNGEEDETSISFSPSETEIAGFSKSLLALVLNPFLDGVSMQVELFKENLISKEGNKSNNDDKSTICKLVGEAKFRNMNIVQELKEIKRKHHSENQDLRSLDFNYSDEPFRKLISDNSDLGAHMNTLLQSCMDGIKEKVIEDMDLKKEQDQGISKNIEAPIPKDEEIASGTPCCEDKEENKNLKEDNYEANLDQTSNLKDDVFVGSEGLIYESKKDPFDLKNESLKQETLPVDLITKSERVRMKNEKQMDIIGASRRRRAQQGYILPQQRQSTLDETSKNYLTSLLVADAFCAISYCAEYERTRLIKNNIEQLFKISKQDSGINPNKDKEHIELGGTNNELGKDDENLYTFPGGKNVLKIYHRLMDKLQFSQDNLLTYFNEASESHCKRSTASKQRACVARGVFGYLKRKAKSEEQEVQDGKDIEAFGDSTGDEEIGASDMYILKRLEDIYKKEENVN